MMKKLVLALIFLGLNSLLFATIDDYRLHLKLIEIEESRPPEVYFDQIIFTYQSWEPVRHVGIAFAHEDFSVIHTYQRNSKGVFFFLLPLPYVANVDYRLIVDGIWMNDPKEVDSVEGSNGVELSRFSVDIDRANEKISPLVGRNNRVTCRYWGKKGETVSLAGDFNNWDPYMFPMKEKTPGFYELTISLPVGVHHYVYYVNGESTLDELNGQVSINPFGEEVSRLVVP